MLASLLRSYQLREGAAVEPADALEALRAAVAWPLAARGASSAEIRNRARTTLKNRWRREGYAERLAGGAEPERVAAGGASAEERAALAQILARLTPGQRRALEGYYGAGETETELAEATGRTRDGAGAAARAALARAKRIAGDTPSEPAPPLTPTGSKRR